MMLALPLIVKSIVIVMSIGAGLIADSANWLSECHYRLSESAGRLASSSLSAAGMLGWSWVATASRLIA